MAAQTFLPSGENPQLDWLSIISQNAPALADKYGFTKDELDDMANGLLLLQAWHAYKIGLIQHTKDVTSYYQELAFGVPAGKTGSVVPVQPVIPALAPLTPGIISRAVAVGKGAKTQTGYTVADGNAMGLIGPEINTDYSNLKGQLSIELVNGGHPEIHWLKHRLDGMQIYKDSGTGVFSLLAYTVHPPTMDNSPLPAAGTSAVWKYKGLYMLHDAPVGQWGDVVSITVAGN